MSLTDITPSGHVNGVAVAIVRENQDDSGVGRVKVSYPWHSQPSDTYWARVATPMAGRKRGVYFMPEVGDEVLVAFERGDLRVPYVVGSLWNTVDSAPETNADGKNDARVIHSRANHKITIHDGSQPLLQLELSDGKRVTIDRNGIQLNDGQGNTVTIESSPGHIIIEAATMLFLKAPAISIEAGGSAAVKSGGALTIQGAIVNIN
jgi:uncharacterized protein involved in type VI secretion and phage assembly